MLTIPITAVSAERSFSGLKTVKKYIRSNCGQDRLSHLATISLESALIDELKKTGVFYNRVIDTFAAKKDRRKDFFFK